MFISSKQWKKLKIVKENAYGEALISWKDICGRYTLELPQPTTNATENKENYF